MLCGFWAAMGTDVNTLNPASMEHLLLTLPIPKPDQLLQRLQTALPDLKITYLRHEVTPTEAFYKQDMYIPPGTDHLIPFLHLSRISACVLIALGVIR
jgi:hypothetical protein